MTPQEFIDQIAPAAQASQAATRIPASFTIAQAALESGWGRSELATKAFNLFGVKADASWADDVLTLPTKEVVNGEWVTVDARWRKYAGWQECLDDHAKFLIVNPRYKPAFDHCDDSVEFARAVAAAGYATDPSYASKIVDIIQAYDLKKFDQAGATAAVPEPGSEPVQPPQPIQPEVTMAGEADIPTSQPTGSAPSVSQVVQAAAPLLGIINPLLGVAAQAIPSIASIVFDKTNTVPERNVKLATSVLNTLQQATGAPTHAEAVARVVDSPEARKAATAALQPFIEMSEIGGGIAALRTQDNALIRSDLPWWAVVRSTSFWAMVFVLPLAYLIILSLVGVIGTAQWTADARAALGGSALGAVIGGVVGYYFGGVTSKNKPAGAL